MKSLIISAWAFLGGLMILHVYSKEVGRSETITVEDNGQDQSDCIQGLHPCQTLSYVLQQLASGANDSIHYIVEVNDDQAMLSGEYENLPTMTIRGNGTKKLVCRDQTQDTTRLTSTDGSVDWENIHWYNCSSPAYLPKNFYAEFKSLAFFNCEFSMLSGFSIQLRTSSLIMNGCSYHNNLNTEFRVTLNQIGMCNISNTILQSNTLTQESRIPSIFTFAHQNQSTISFHAFNYTGNKASLMFIHALALERNDNSLTLQFSSCHFQNNSFTIIKPMVIEDPSSDCMFIDYFVINSTFTGNRNNISDAMFEHGVDTAQVMCVNAKIHDSKFQNNSGSLVLVLDNTNIPPSNISIKNTVFLHNNAQNNIISISCIQCNVWIVNTTINTTHLKSYDPYAAVTKISYTTQVNQKSARAHIIDCLFFRNLGTPLAVISENSAAPLYFDGHMTFIENEGVVGGGMFVKNMLVDPVHATFYFEKNEAFYGGAISTFMSDWCNNDSKNLCGAESFTFKDNTAIASGHSVFTDDELCDYFHAHDSSIDGVSSLPSKYNESGTVNRTTRQVFPGQNIILDYIVHGCLNSTTSCTANIMLACQGSQEISCSMNGTNVGIEGPSSVFLTTEVIDTNLIITTSKEPEAEMPLQVSLWLTCEMNSTKRKEVKLNVTKCPNGLKFDDTSMKCKCNNLSSENFLCYPDQNQICIRSGYWLGDVDNIPVLSPCHLPYCHSTGGAHCNIPGAYGYIQVNETKDNQCMDHRGGTLCRECTQGYNFTFEAKQCIPCELRVWQPVLLLLLAILYQLTLGFLLILSLRLDLKSGLGTLYGILFFMAVISNVSFVNLSFLKTTITIMTSFALFSLEMFGYIPWCFFRLTPLEHFAFHYLSLMVIVVVLLFTVIMARVCPKCILGASPSPVRAVCLLLLVSFWSLAENSLQVLDYIKLDGVDHVRVSLQPDIHYLSKEHIPLWIVSILVLTAITILALLLLLAPFLSRFFNLTSIKPLLDEFQSCFKDKYRSYSAVYLISWIAFRLLVSFKQDELLQFILIFLAVAQTILHPYESKWLNISDTILLWCLVTITGLSQDLDNTESQVLICVLIILPLAYFLFVFLYTILRHVLHYSGTAKYFRKLRRRKQCKKQKGVIKKKNVPVSEVAIESTHLREPLLAEDMQDYTSDSD